MKSKTLLKSDLSFTKKKLKDGGTIDPSGSAEAIFCYVLKMTREELFATDKNIPLIKKIKINRLVQRRLTGEPISQIIGKVDFCGVTVRVNRNVLTPRPETEMLILAASEYIDKSSRTLSILDVGTGSGAIICALGKKFKDSKVTHGFYASDISSKALRVAKGNAKLNGLLEIVFKKGSLFNPWQKQKFDVILANLPYLPTTDRDKVSKDVSGFEPHEALFSGTDGLNEYRDFLKQLGRYVHKNSIVLCEIGDGQGEKIAEIAKEYLPQASIKIEKDLAMFDRVVTIRITK